MFPLTVVFACERGERNYSHSVCQICTCDNSKDPKEGTGWKGMHGRNDHKLGAQYGARHAHAHACKQMFERGGGSTFVA
jgi:hypothetical protein